MPKIINIYLLYTRIYANTIVALFLPRTKISIVSVIKNFLRNFRKFPEFTYIFETIIFANLTLIIRLTLLVKFEKPR